MTWANNQAMLKSVKTSTLQKPQEICLQFKMPTNQSDSLFTKTLSRTTLSLVRWMMQPSKRELVKEMDEACQDSSDHSKDKRISSFKIKCSSASWTKGKWSSNRLVKKSSHSNSWKTLLPKSTAKSLSLMPSHANQGCQSKPWNNSCTLIWFKSMD